MAADFYRELGVSRTATADEIRRAYRKLAMQYHPDKNPDNPAAETRFKAINRAHDVLSDVKKRSLYDRFGETGLREGFDPDMARRYPGGKGGGFGGGLEDIFGGNFSGFGDLFGDVFKQRATAKGQDAAADVNVDFISALRGANVAVRIPGVEGELTVRVPPGANDGDRVRVAGHGSPGRQGGSAGDLLLTIRVLPHEYFERDGLDLKLDLPVSVFEAYHGAKIRVPTPHGDVSLKMPAHAQSGQVVRLKGKGVERKGKVGDLFVRFMVRVPEEESKALEKAVQTLGDATDLGMRDKIRI